MSLIPGLIEVGINIFYILYLYVQLFLKRHPVLSIRTPERVSKARASVTEDGIRTWFTTLKSEVMELDALDIFSDPSRVFNADESNLQLCPKTGKVVGVKGWKNCYQLAPGPEESTLTFLGTFSASGEIVCPAVIYPYERISSDIVNKVPDNFYGGSSESGWMKSETFFEFVANAFIPYLKEKDI